MVYTEWNLSVANVNQGAGLQLVAVKNSPCPAGGILINNPTAAALTVILFPDQAPSDASPQNARRIVDVGSRTLYAQPTSEFVGVAVYASLATPLGSRSNIIVQTMDTVDPMAGQSTPGSATSLADASGTIAAASTSQTALAAGAATRYLFIENVAGTSSGTIIWVNFGTAATAGAGSIALGPGQAIEYTALIPSDAVQVLSTSVGAPFTIKYA
jgi:hypothetical protein